MCMFPINTVHMMDSFFSKGKKSDSIRLPIEFVIADMPDIHNFGDASGRRFMKQLTSLDKSLYLFETKYVQALIEVKWPPVRAAIMTHAFIPFLIYLLLFNFYMIYLI